MRAADAQTGLGLRGASDLLRMTLRADLWPGIGLIVMDCQVAPALLVVRNLWWNEKHLVFCKRQGVFGDQILRLRPQNDTDISAPLVFLSPMAKHGVAGAGSGLKAETRGALAVHGQASPSPRLLTGFSA